MYVRMLMVITIAVLIGAEVASEAGQIAGLIIASALPFTFLIGKRWRRTVSNDFLGLSLLKHEIAGIENGETGKLLLNASRDNSFRSEVLKRIEDLPDELLEGLKAGKWQLDDMFLYFTYQISTNSYVQVINDSDKKEVGLTNVNSGKLDENTYFLMCGIRMLYGSNADIKVTQWGTITTKPILANGEFTVIHGGSTMVPRSSNIIFDTSNTSKELEGYYRLANPKWLKPGVKTDVNVWLSGQGVDNDNIRIEIYGAAVYKA